MLAVFLPIFVVDTEIVFRYDFDFVAPLISRQPFGMLV